MTEMKLQSLDLVLKEEAEWELWETSCSKLG